MIAQAQSGTGKTAAYSLAVLSNVDVSKKFPQAVVLCHARELAVQVIDVMRQLAKQTQIEMQLILPQIDIPRTLLSQILVSTPGKFLDMLKTKRFNPGTISLFVLDEADVMLQAQGLQEQTMRIRDQLPRDCMILLFSATYGGPVAKFAQEIVPLPRKMITLKREELSLDKITQYYLDTGNESSKLPTLVELFQFLTAGQTIIFVYRRDTATLLHKKLTAEGHRVSLLHGGKMEAQNRDAVMASFRKGETKVLITTNVLARGIDVLQVTLVINYDLPLDKFNRADFSTYLHRIGRSGRYGRPGIAINIVHDNNSRANLKAIDEFFAKKKRESEEKTGVQQGVENRIKPFPKENLEMLGEMLHKIAQNTAVSATPK